jgi:hypothetical protein
MKKIIFLALIIAGLKSFSQSVAINTSGNAANTSAMLDVSSTNKGFLAPRMTTAQRTSIASPADGLLVYDTDTKSFWYFSITWKETNLNNGGGGGSFSLPYAGTGSSNDKLFSINNTSITDASVGIYGKIGVGGTVVLGTNTVGVWGDNPGGTGVFGTSNTKPGVWGLSLGYHSIYGEGTAAGFAGVYGLANSMGTYGVMGEAVNFNTAGVYGKSSNIGKSALFETPDSSNNDTTVLVKSVGTGDVLTVEQNNPYTSGNTFSAFTKGYGPAIFGQSANGYAAFFKKINNSSFSDIVGVENNALGGTAINVNMKNGSNTNPALNINHLGQGSGISINLTSPANEQNIIHAGSNGVGGGIDITLSNVISAGDGLNVSTAGTGYGIAASSKKSIVERLYSYPGNNSEAFSLQNDGNGESVDIFQSNASNANPAIRSYTSGNGPAIHGIAEGTGPALLINNLNSNAVNSLATFQKLGVNKARIDGTGKGFFNGGTQNSGADLAEVFDVTGNIQEYEMGDVLVISTDKDRTVERSTVAYSTLVAGVYATKPGVLLTEENIDTDISGKVPMGVVGVIPTKVCLEGGDIKRGDLLVTSSIPGVAMKADLEKVKPGQVIGKALENFDATSVGKIKVLVNVK